MKRELATFFGALFGVILLLFSYLPLLEGTIETGDYASNALGVLLAEQGRATLGPYSRLGFFHPGPLLFYWQAFFDLILEPPASHIISGIILNALALLLILRGTLHPLSSLIFIVLVSIFLPAIWLDPWGPYVVVLPLVAAVVGINSKDIVSLLLAVFLASLAMQTHITTVLVGAPVLVALIYKNKKYRISLILFILLLWSFPLIEVLFNSGGNIQEIVLTALEIRPRTKAHSYLFYSLYGILFYLLSVYLLRFFTIRSSILRNSAVFYFLVAMLATFSFSTMDHFLGQCSQRVKQRGAKLHSQLKEPQTIRIRIEKGTFNKVWPEALGVGLYLARKGERVCFSGRLKRVVPKEFRCDGKLQEDDFSITVEA